VKNIKICFTTKKSKFNILSHIIKLFEGTKFSHSNILFTNRTGRHLVYEASGFPGSVKFDNLRNFLLKNEIITAFELELTDAQAQDLLDILLDNLGRPYSFMGLCGMAFVRLFSLKNNPFSDGREAFVCTELVAFILTEFFPESLDRVNLDTVGLKDLEFLVSNLSLKRVSL